MEKGTILQIIVRTADLAHLCIVNYIDRLTVELVVEVVVVAACVVIAAWVVIAAVAVVLAAWVVVSACVVVAAAVVVADWAVVAAAVEVVAGLVVVVVVVVGAAAVFRAIRASQSKFCLRPQATSGSKKLGFSKKLCSSPGTM